MHQLILDAGCCRLRPWQPALDIDSLVRYGNNPKISGNLRDRFAYPYTTAHAEAYFASIENSPDPIFAIDVDGEAVGSCGLHVRADIHRFSAEFGYWVAEPFWGRGLGSAAARRLSDYGLHEMGLLRVFATVFFTNPASMRALEKAGFTREAVLRCDAVKNGVLLDQVLYARIRPSDLPYEPYLAGAV